MSDGASIIKHDNQKLCVTSLAGLVHDREWPDRRGAQDHSCRSCPLLLDSGPMQDDAVSTFCGNWVVCSFTLITFVLNIRAGLAVVSNPARIGDEPRLTS